MSSPCQGCGEQPERCRCDGPMSTLGEDLAFGFHVETLDAEEFDDYTEDMDDE